MKIELTLLVLMDLLLLLDLNRDGLNKYLDSEGKQREIRNWGIKAAIVD